MTKKDVSWLIVCILLAVALVVSVILGVNGFYSSVAYLKSQTDLVVGENIILAVEPNSVATTSFTFNGAYFPNEEIPQVLQINATNCQADSMVRVKSTVSGSDQNFTFVTSDHFTLKDGYYYYDQILEQGTKITFCTAMITPSESEFVSGESYILTFVVETLDPEFASEIWGV